MPPVCNVSAVLAGYNTAVMELLKSITGKIVTGLLGLAVVIGAISWWQMDVTTRQTLLSNTGRILAWLGVVLVVPWATFAVIARVNRLERNVAGGILVGIYSLIELVLLGWLFHWSIHTVTAWTFLILGGLLAGVYNLLTCDWIAEKME